MSENKNPDEMIEIVSDGEPSDDDVKIYRVERNELPAADEEPEEVQNTAYQPDTPEDAVAEETVTEALPEEESGSDEAALEETDGQEEEALSEGDGTLKPDEETVTGDDGRTEEYESDDFSAEMAEMDNESAEGDLLDEIGDSLYRQMQIDLATENRDATIKQPFSIKMIPWWVYLAAGLVLLIIGTVCWLGLSDSGRSLLLSLGSRYAAGEVEYEEVGEVEKAEVADDKSSREISADVPKAEAVVTPQFDWETEVIPGMDSDTPATAAEGRIYNILIVGEENLDQEAKRGRTDAILIASIDEAGGRLMLTSVMRDSLVAIPGDEDNRINAAYSIGGMALLYETLKVNLGITFDNYVLVSFEAFERMIDMMGGVDITLTAEEADYLDTTNYISDKNNRNVVAGLNHLNGNQALGYCRVRKVDTDQGDTGDSGRSQRQRNVMNAALKALADMGSVRFLSFANRCLPYVRTDMTAADIENYAQSMIKIGLDTKPEELRIPVQGTCQEVNLREMLVLKMDLDRNSRALHFFIYGEGT